MRNGKAIFFLHSHNEVDQIVPIIYGLARRGRVDIDIVLTGVESGDYRIDLIRDFDTVSIHGRDGATRANSHSPTLRERTNIALKQVGRKLPTRIPGGLYRRLASSSESVDYPAVLDSLTDGYENVVILVDWSKAKASSAISEFAGREGYTTVVLPHGDSPFQNAARTERTFERLVESEDCFEDQHDLFEVVFSIYETMADHDYMLMPNELTARRITPFVDDAQVRVCGSPRYNPEWLAVLSGAEPGPGPDQSAALNLVLFTRRSTFFVSEQAVRDTIRLVTSFPDVHLVVKEHPRGGLLDEDSRFENIDNCEIVRDEMESATLTAWGDAFLSLGTSITFEPVMNGKPVLALEYAHGNYTTIAHYFSESDIRSRDDLYRAIHALRGDTETFYPAEEHRQFVDEMILAGTDSVLETYATFIEEQLGVES